MASQYTSLVSPKVSKFNEMREMREMVVMLLRGDMRTLNSLALASRLWKADVQKVIFRDITLSFTQRRSAHDFVRALVTSTDRSLHTSFYYNIRTLTLKGSPEPPTRWYGNHEMRQPNLSVNEICTIVGCLTRLVKLRLRYLIVDGPREDLSSPRLTAGEDQQIEVRLNRIRITSSALYTLLKYTKVRELVTFRINVQGPLAELQPDMLAYAHTLTLCRKDMPQRQVAQHHWTCKEDRVAQDYLPSDEDWVTKMYEVASSAALTTLGVSCNLKSGDEWVKLKQWLPIMGANLEELHLNCSETTVGSVQRSTFQEDVFACLILMLPTGVRRERWIEDDRVFDTCDNRMQLRDACRSLRAVTLVLSIDQEGARASPHGGRRVVEDTDTFVMWIFASRLLEAAPPTLDSITISLRSHDQFNFRYVLPMDTTLRMVPWDRWRNTLLRLPLLQELIFVVPATDVDQDFDVYNPSYSRPEREFDWKWMDHLHALLEAKGVARPSRSRK
ncbi:hypothetical protein EUX98_g8679 [Antrodiella citrinella]|uniref:F-box domain-containing protein n=1 Tax=Antrodiella citrinella TaxID=2447956 RepID=A0A4S4M431_9APHY|nr:hypothetical protein EUX98_g8679 [Antrodiella citrinella]